MARSYEQEEYHGEYRGGSYFADPGGRSALRAASKRNRRNRPCPTSGGEHRLTAEDVHRGYQCNSCADREEE